MNRGRITFFAIWLPLTMAVGYFTFREEPLQRQGRKDPIASILARKGNVQMRPELELIWHKTSEKQLLYERDNIATAESSTAQIELFGIGKINLEPETQIKLVIPPGKKDNFELQLLTGSMQIATTFSTTKSKKVVVTSGTGQFELAKGKSRLSLAQKVGQKDATIMEASAGVVLKKFSQHDFNVDGTLKAGAEAKNGAVISPVRASTTLAALKDGLTSVKSTPPSILGLTGDQFSLAARGPSAAEKAEQQAAALEAERSKLAAEQEAKDKQLAEEKDRLLKNQKALSEKQKKAAMLALSAKKSTEHDEAELAASRVVKCAKAEQVLPELLDPKRDGLRFITDQPLSRAKMFPVTLTVGRREVADFPPYWVPLLTGHNAGGSAKAGDKLMLSEGDAVTKKQHVSFTLGDLIEKNFVKQQKTPFLEHVATVALGDRSGPNQESAIEAFAPPLELSFLSIAEINDPQPIGVSFSKPNEREISAADDWVSMQAGPTGYNYELQLYNGITDLKLVFERLVTAKNLKLRHVEAGDTGQGIYFAKNRKIIAKLSRAPTAVFTQSIKGALGSDVVYQGNRHAYIGDLVMFKELLNKKQIPQIFYVLHKDKFIEINLAFMQTHPSVGQFLDQNATAFFREPIIVVKGEDEK